MITLTVSTSLIQSYSIKQINIFLSDSPFEAKKNWLKRWIENEMDWNRTNSEILWIKLLISLMSLDGVPFNNMCKRAWKKLKHLSRTFRSDEIPIFQSINFKVERIMSIAFICQIQPQRCEESIKIYYLSFRLTPRHSQRDHSRKSLATPSAWMEMENCFLSSHLSCSFVVNQPW